jgi:hypothetical protein
VRGGEQVKLRIILAVCAGCGWGEESSGGGWEWGGSKRRSLDITYNLNLNSCGLIIYSAQIQYSLTAEIPRECHS